MKLILTFLLGVIYIATNFHSKRLCIGINSDCREKKRLSVLCDDFKCSDTCSQRHDSCYWNESEGKCLEKACESIGESNFCYYNFNCEWDINTRKCIKRSVVY